MPTRSGCTSSASSSSFANGEALREYARRRDIRIIGDIPIFVAADSADVWANPDLFQLDADRRPKVVAGVPPDYFSETGQLWGNPLYDWEALRRPGYAWWVARFRALMDQSTWSGSTISAASRPTGKCRPAGPTPSRAAGSRRRARSC